MARILEDHAKRVLAGFGIATPRGQRVVLPDDAVAVAADMPGGSVVKALVPAGRRGHAGLVVLCSALDDVRGAAERMLGRVHDGYRVEALLVEERLTIAREYYLSISIDTALLQYALLLSANGGVDIEAHAETVTRVDVSPLAPFDADMAAAAWRSAGAAGSLEELGETTALLVAAFRSLDATLLEINPLAEVAEGRIVAVGAMLAVDDLARARQPEVERYFVEGSDRATRPETALERRTARINADSSERGSARYLELEGGNIGFLCGGGGASLLLFDALVAAGGAPANYSEFGGNPTEQRVYDLTRVVLDKPGVQGLFVAHNITNNTQVDVVARGVTRAVQAAGLPDSFPVVAREVGVNDEEGKRIFEEAGFHYLGADVSLNRAAQVMAAKMREATAE